jgi:hypothetical protein
LFSYKKITLLSSILVISLFSSADANIPVVINELMASNNNCIQDPQGQYDDWIEIYNYGPNDIDIGGMYLTDDISVPNKWRFPSTTIIHGGGYLLIWADDDINDIGFHANFQLDSDGEEIGLIDSDGQTFIDSIDFPDQFTDISFGRYPDANETWRFFDTPSPAAQNEGGYLGKVADIKFSHGRGFYDTPFLVTITTETEDATIYYTLDGSDPLLQNLRGTPHGTIYTGPILISGTTPLRAVATKTDWKSTNVGTQTYIFLDDVIEQPQYPPGFPTSWGSTRADYEMDPDVVDDPAYAFTIKQDLQTIPSVCIVLDNGDLFGSQLGIYANASGRGTNWEREASIEWIDPINGTDFQVNAGLRMHGGVGRTSGIKKSLRILFKNEYGPSQLRFPLFEDTNVETFDSLVLRASWNYSYFGDSTYCEGIGTEHTQYLRDQFARDTMRDMGGLTPYGRHVHLYINGLYWGLYILAERPDDGFAANHLGGEKEDYEVLKASSGTPLDIISGDRNAWNTLFNLAAQNLGSTAAYESIQQYLDIPAMIDYLLMIYYVGSRDAPVLLCNDNNPRNFYTLRRREPAGPFIFLPWDVEWSLEWPDWWRANRVEIVGRENPHYLLNRLNSNSEFRMLLADHIHRHFFNGGALTPAKSIDRYLFRANEIDRAIVGESARWGDSRRSRPYTRDLEWVAERDRMIYEYFSIRTDIVLDQLRQAGFYPAVSAPEFYVNDQPQHGGYINFDDTISMDTAEETIWYTLDGTDPRSPETTTQPSNQLTLVSENANKRVLVPTGQISEDWKTSINYRDSSWRECRGGVGYDTEQNYRPLFYVDLYDQMYQEQTSCFIQIPFDAPQDRNQFDMMTLRMRYDDGFVAYINGVEVARRNFTGTPAWNSNANAIHDDSAAVEFEDINVSLHLDILRADDNILAIHGLNVSLTSSDFLISTELVLIQSSVTNPAGISSTAIQYNEAFQLTHSTNLKARRLSGSTWSALNEAIFAVGPVAENLRITEIMYHPQSTAGQDDPNEEFIELKNIGTETINLKLVKFTNGIDFTFPSLELAPNEYVVIVQDFNAFETRYSADINIAGQYTGQLANNGERIRLEDAIGQTILDFRYKDSWYDSTDGQGLSLTIADPSNSDTQSWDSKSAWRPSDIFGGSPGRDDSIQ